MKTDLADAAALPLAALFDTSTRYERTNFITRREPPMDASRMVKVAFRAPDDVLETLWATPVGIGLYRIENSPFFFYGISYLDIVRADVGENGDRAFVEVVMKSGHRTLRVMMEDTRSSEANALMKEIAEQGASYEGFPPALLVIHLPPSVNFDSVVNLLKRRDLRFEYADPRRSALFENV